MAIRKDYNIGLLNQPATSMQNSFCKPNLTSVKAIGMSQMNHYQILKQQTAMITLKK